MGPFRGEERGTRWETASRRGGRAAFEALLPHLRGTAA